MLQTRWLYYTTCKICKKLPVNETVKLCDIDLLDDLLELETDRNLKCRL
jgi:hypothetical protein